MSSGDQPRKEELDLVHEIDKKLAPTATRTGKSEPDSFDAIRDRFMSLMSRFQVIKDTLGDFNKLPNELHPAAFVFNETVEEMVRFYGELHRWHMAHEQAPNKVQS
jgi:hypothetical protein